MVVFHPPIRLIGLRSQVVYSKQPKLGLTLEFVLLLVRMRLVVCMYVCLFVCLFVCYSLFVCLFSMALSRSNLFRKNKITCRIAHIIWEIIPNKNS